MSQQLPVTIGNLTDLVHLDLSSNCLDEKALPDNFFTLVRLQRLYLSDNSIKYIDSRFGGLNQLKILALRNNQISRISSQALQGLALLQELHLQVTHPGLQTVKPTNKSSDGFENDVTLYVGVGCKVDIVLLELDDQVLVV